MKKLWLFIGFFFMQIAFASAVDLIKPLTIKMADDDQVRVGLSNRDMNRLFVAGDKIVRFDVPNNRVVAHNDQSGSIFMHVLGRVPFTAFVTTQAGRHFSFFVVPNRGPGVTVRVVATTPVTYRHYAVPARRFESSLPYEKTLVSLLQEVMLGRTPSGYVAISARAFEKIAVLHVPRYLGGRHFLSERVVSGFLGGALAVRVVKLTNESNHGVVLVARDFYLLGVRAVAVVKGYLAPQQWTYVYEVLSNASF